jgi:hypothetical protein
MTYLSRKEAEEAARKVQKRMKSKGWKIRVWENLGWHFEIKKGTIQLHEASHNGRRPYYWTLMGSELNSYGGETYLLADETPKIDMQIYDPNDAYLRQLKVAKAHLDKIAKAIKVSS